MLTFLVPVKTEQQADRPNHVEQLVPLAEPQYVDVETLVELAAFVKATRRAMANKVTVAAFIGLIY